MDDLDELDQSDSDEDISALVCENAAKRPCFDEGHAPLVAAALEAPQAPDDVLVNGWKKTTNGAGLPRSYIDLNVWINIEIFGLIRDESR